VQEQLTAERDRLAAENAAYLRRFRDCGLRWAGNQQKMAEPRTRLMLAAYRLAEIVCDKVPRGDEQDDAEEAYEHARDEAHGGDDG